MQSSGIDTEPAYASNGRAIYFVSDRGGSPQIYRVASTGGSLLSRLAGAQSGTATLGAGTGVTTYTVAFPAAFAAVPGQVLVTVRSQTGGSFVDTFAVTTRNITSTGFQVNVNRADTNGAWGQSLLLDWLAIP